MNRHAYRLFGKIVTGTATERDRQLLAHLTQEKANYLKPVIVGGKLRRNPAYVPYGREK